MRGQFRNVPIPHAIPMEIAGRAHNPGWVLLTTPAYVDGTGATVPPPAALGVTR